LTVAFDGDQPACLTDEDELIGRVDIGDRVDQLVLELDVGRIVPVLHLLAELEDEVPRDELTVLTVVEVSASESALLLEAFDEDFVQGLRLGSGTVAPLGSLIRGQTTPSERRGALRNEASCPLSSDPSGARTVRLVSFVSSCDIVDLLLELFYPQFTLGDVAECGLEHDDDADKTGEADERQADVGAREDGPGGFSHWC